MTDKLEASRLTPETLRGIGDRGYLTYDDTIAIVAHADAWAADLEARRVVMRAFKNEADIGSALEVALADSGKKLEQMDNELLAEIVARKALEEQLRESDEQTQTTEWAKAPEGNATLKAASVLRSPE